LLFLGLFLNFRRLAFASHSVNHGGPFHMAFTNYLQPIYYGCWR